MIENNTLFEEDRQELNQDVSASIPRENIISETDTASSAKQALDAITPAKKAPKEKTQTSISGRLLSAVSHDIRTSLTGIVGMAQLVSDTELNTEQRNYINAIQQSSSSLLKTINYVLDIASLESGKMELNESAADLHSLCKKVMRIMRPLADLKSLNLSCVCDDSVPLSIMCDENLMEHLISNLLQNSINNTDQGSVSLNISCPGKSQKGADFVFRISDTRSEPNSFAANQEPPLQKNDHAASSVSENTEGMEQIIIHHLLELLGGKLEISEENGIGYTSIIHVTLQQANRPAPLVFANVDQVKKIIKPNLRVLFAEDNKLNQKVVEKLLSNAGCEVDTASNGTIALQKLQTFSYDLVIMDCQMPVMDGYEATAAIRNMGEPTSQIPIIAVTANALAKDKQKCLDSGMNAYLTKPIDRQELIELINKFTAG
ncbi:response regulator [Pontiellaceae bacterium B1224]|nr:response regulator [Pontiellaceae bacterium B1224]